MHESTVNFMKLLSERSELKNYKFINCEDVYTTFAINNGMMTPDLLDKAIIRPDRLSAKFKEFQDELIRNPGAIADYKNTTNFILSEMGSNAFRQTVKKISYSFDRIKNKSYDLGLAEAKKVYREYFALSTVAFYQQMLTDSVNSDITYELYPFCDAWGCKLAFSGSNQVINPSDDMKKTLSTYNIHPPFDKCVFIFGTYAVVYTRKGNIGSIVIMTHGLNKSGTMNKTAVCPSISFQVKLNSSGTFVDFDYDYEYRTVFDYGMKSADVKNALAYLKSMFSIDQLNAKFNQFSIEETGKSMPSISAMTIGTYNTLAYKSIPDLKTLSDLDRATLLASNLSLIMRPILSSFVFSCLMSTCRSLRMTESTVHVQAPKNHSHKQNTNKSYVVPESKPLTYSNVFISPEHIIQHGYSGDHEHGERDVTMHVRRGHFKTYTNARPLFGRFSGIVWIPPTIVGNRGTMKKTDYAISIDK